jgi:hypothetical protein
VDLPALGAEEAADPGEHDCIYRVAALALGGLYLVYILGMIALRNIS